MPQDQYQRTFPLSHVPAIHPALLYDDCNGTFLWKQALFGAEMTAEYDPSAALVGLNGILLKTDGISPATNEFADIYRDIWLPAEERVRMQACFNLQADSPQIAFAVILHWYTGLTHYVGGLQVNSASGIVQYASSIAAGTISWTQIAGWLCQNSDDSWNRADISINLRTLAYHRLNLNEHVIDGADLPFPSEASGLGKYMEPYFHLQTLEDNQAVVFIDQVLVTPENP